MAHVVYFNQGLGDAHAKRRLKYAFLHFLCLKAKKNCKKVGNLLQKWEMEKVEIDMKFKHICSFLFLRFFSFLAKKC